MQHKIVKLLLAVVIVAGTIDSSPRAATMRIDFIAIVDLVDNMLCQCLGNVEIGDTIRGHYIYESGAVDSDPDPHLGLYEYSALPNGVLVNVDTLVFQTAPDSLDIDFFVGDSLSSGGLHDLYWFISNNNVETTRDFPTSFIFLKLVDNTAAALSSDSLPVTAPELSQWQDENLLLIAGRGNEWGIFAHLISALLDPPTGIKANKVDFTLYQNFPNPFNPSTQIPFALERSDNVQLAIYDVSGGHIRKLVDRRMGSGSHLEEWDGRDAKGRTVASGVYFYRLMVGSSTITRRLVLLR